MKIIAIMAGLATVSAFSGCKQQSSGLSNLRNATFQAPFSARLTASENGWGAELSQYGAPTQEYAVTEVSYVSTNAAADGIPDGVLTAGSVTFSANLNYTFQFNVEKKDPSGKTIATALCDTSYAAPLGYVVESTFVKCNTDLTRAGFNNGQNGQSSESELSADRTISLAIISNTATIKDAVTHLAQDSGFQFSPDTVTRWNKLERSIQSILARYAGSEQGATEEIINVVTSAVQAPDAPRLAEALIQAYTRSGTQNGGTPPEFVGPPAPQGKASCVCDREQCDWSWASFGWSCGQIAGTIPVPGRDGDGASCAAYSQYVRVPLDGKPINESSSYYQPINCRLVNK